MDQPKIAVYLASLLPAVNKDIKAGIRKTKELGFAGVQFHHVNQGDWKDLPLKDKMALLNYPRELGLTVTGAACYASETDLRPVRERLAQLCQAIDLCAACRIPIVIIHGGESITKKTAEECRQAWIRLIENLKYAAAYARDHGVMLAMEASGPGGMVHSWKILVRLRNEVGELFKVNYDPANVTMTGENAVDGARALGQAIVHLHVKDAGMKYPCPTVQAFNRQVDKSKDDFDFSQYWQAVLKDCPVINGKIVSYFKETPVGEGLVDFKGLLTVLHQAGYKGWWAIEREGGDDRPGEILRARDHLLRAAQAQ